MRKILLFLLVVSITSLANAQDSNNKAFEPVWNLEHHDSAASFRGVHVDPNGESVWVSGSRGLVLRTSNGGETWDNVSPPDAGEFDFRDVHGFPGGEHALVMAVGSPARIYRAGEYGHQWELVYEDKRPEIFLDAMAFWDGEEGIAFGDPIDGKIVILRTSDGGKTWQELDREKQPDALEGEGGFAASGTCLCVTGNKTVYIGLGGARKEGAPSNARMLMSNDRGESWKVIETPIKSGAASGIFSIAFADEMHGVAVGGTYDKPEIDSDNICITEDGGKSWTRPESATRGYRSCVVCKGKGKEKPVLIAVSKTGTDYSVDFGKSWKPLDDQGFYAVDSNSRGSCVIAVGPEGRIGVLPVPGLELD